MSYTLRCVNTLVFTCSVDQSSPETLAGVMSGLPEPGRAALHFNGQGQDPSHFLSADFTDKLQWCFTQKLFLEKNILF